MLLNYCNRTTISTFIVLPSSRVLCVIFILDLNDLESVN